MQTHNAQLVENLTSFFIRRNETQLQLSQAIALFQSLPGLRGFWPMSAIDSSGNAIDQSGHGHTLTYNGNPTYNQDGLAPYIDLDGTGDYLSRADESDLDIDGTESYIVSGLNGLTMGGWFYPDAGGIQILMSKTGGGSNASYSMFIGSSTSLTARVSNNGTTLVDQSASLSSSILSKWNLFVIRYDPSAELLMRVMNADEDTSGSLTSGVPASLFNSSAPFNIGNRNSSTSFLYNGRASLCFLCAAALPDSIISTLFNVSRGVFEV